MFPFFQSGGASRWRVCFQRGLHCIILEGAAGEGSLAVAAGVAVAVAVGLIGFGDTIPTLGD